MELLSDDAVAEGVDQTEWRHEDSAIHRDREFKDFAEAMAYVNRIADAAEAADHHPDILVHGWNNVRLTLTTHSAGGITQADLDMAKTLDAVE